jgi:hypothetical protein
MTCVIHVLPDRLVGSGIPSTRRWWGPPATPAARWTEPFDHRDDMSQALARVLERTRAFGRDVAFVVSDAWCHYQLVQRPDGVSARRQLDALNRARFQAILGDEADALRLVVYRPPNATADLVVGLPEHLVATLHQGAKLARRTARHIRPYWVECARATHVREAAPYWLFSDDGASRTLALFQGHQCLGVRGTRHRRGDDTLATLLAREIPLHDVAARATSIHVWGTHAVANGAPRAGALAVVQHGELAALLPPTTAEMKGAS